MGLFERGPQGPAGPAGTKGKELLSGSGAPDADVGVNGDHYLDRDTSELYGPKANGEWGDPTALGGSSSVADDIAKQGGTNINRVRGQNGVLFTFVDGTTPTDGAAPPEGATWTAAPMRGSSKKLYPLNPHPAGWFDPRMRGAKGDGASHPLSDYFGSLGAAQAIYPHATSLTNEIDWAAIQSCLNTMKTARPGITGRDVLGGRLHLDGRFLCDQTLDFHLTRSIVIEGCGQGIVGAVDGISTLIYTGGGRRFLDGRSSNGFVMRNIAVAYSNHDFTFANGNREGRLVDMSNGFGPDTAQFSFENCWFGAAPSCDIALDQVCHSLVFLSNAIIGTFKGCVFLSAEHGVYGKKPDGSYCNAIGFYDCQWLYCRWATANAGQNWHYVRPTFEGTGGYCQAAYADRNPKVRASVDFPLTFDGSTIARSDGGSWLDDGFRRGYVTNSINANEAGNVAVNGFPILTRVTDDELDFTAVTITLSGNTITRDYGRFDDDGWTVGMVPTLALTGCPQNGVQGAISAISVDGQTLTITGAAYGGSADYTAGHMRKVVENEFVAVSYASTGWNFTTEESDDALVFVKASGGPISFHGGWFGDQYLDGAWLQFDSATSVSLRDNFISTSAENGRVMTVAFSTTGFVADGNYFQCSLEPIALSTERETNLCSIDGAKLEFNYGDWQADSIWIIPESGIDIRGLQRRGNKNDEAEVSIDLDNDDGSSNWNDSFASEVLEVTSTTPFTADRTLNVPRVYNDAGCVYRFIRNAQAGAFNLIVSANGVGTTVAIPPGAGKWVGIDASGCFEMGATVPAAIAVPAMAIDWSKANVHTKTLAAGANTFTFANASSGKIIVVRVTSNGGGSTLTWPTVKWPGGTPPTQTPTGTDVYTFIHDGTSIYGSVVQDMS